MSGRQGKKDKERPQIERFKKMAKELGADVSAEAFEREFKRVVISKDAKGPMARRGRQS